MGNAWIEERLMQDRYVLLTGAKNNAGDFLIRSRGVNLLTHLRPDRDLVVLNGWQPLGDEQLEIINDSRALILMGGPALQFGMHGSVYALCDDLDRIKAPVLTMGIGWKSARGSWVDSRSYPLSDRTLALLEKIRRSGEFSSVRDYHTLNVLQHHGFDNFEMTGCPALYVPDRIDGSLETADTVTKVSFSLGVAFVHDARMDAQMKELLSNLAKRFGAGNLTAVFHHALRPEQLSQVYGGEKSLFAEAHQRLADWLDSKGIGRLDISGEVDAMLAHYANTDLHIGYRVHAHILRLSLNLPSLLIAEDGRGRALQHFLGSSVCCAGNDGDSGLLDRMRSRFGMARESDASVAAVPNEVMNLVGDEMRTDFSRSRQSVAVKNAAFGNMERFVRALP